MTENWWKYITRWDFSPFLKTRPLQYWKGSETWCNLCYYGWKSEQYTYTDKNTVVSAKETSVRYKKAYFASYRHHVETFSVCLLLISSTLDSLKHTRSLIWQLCTNNVVWCWAFFLSWSSIGISIEPDIHFQSKSLLIHISEVRYRGIDLNLPPS